jgi:hypothetical protein
MPQKKIVKNNFGLPWTYALARNRAGGDWAAGLLLFRLMWRWRMKKKLSRLGKEWVAMSRSDWAREAGLSEGEMKNRALPNLRKQPFVTIRAMKLGEKKLLWMHLDDVAAYEHTEEWDFHDAILNGNVLGQHKQPYPYQDKFIENAPASDECEAPEPTE